MGKNIDTIVTKLTSARFLLTIMFGLTLCWMAAIEVSVRDAFFALAGGVIRDYFGMIRKEDSNAKPTS